MALRKVIYTMLLSVFSIFVVIQLIVVVIGYNISAPGYDGPKSAHFDGTRFSNHRGIKAKGFFDLVKWALNRKPGVWKKKSDMEPYDTPLPVVSNGARVTFVNHSTFLIQVNNINILTDPVWSERVSPFTWIGPARMRPPGIRFEDLPKIHFILLSHNHYDHLDIATLHKLYAQHKPMIITPLGVKKFLEEKNIAGANDVDWWETFELNDDVNVEAVPAQHFSGRGLFDRDKTLWCGYVIKSAAGNIYFAGDTGYNNETFQEVGERSGPIKLALIPIGAYKPNWFMSPIHTSPEDAVKIHLDVKAEASIGIHFGTFPLADDGQSDPTEDLEKARVKYNIPDSAFFYLSEGGHFEFN